MLPWWAAIVFLFSGFFIGMVCGRTLGISQAGQQLQQAMMRQGPAGMPDLGGMFGRGAEHSPQGSTPRA